MLRPTLWRRIRPLPRRSSVTKARPARRAAAIEASRAGVPAISIVPSQRAARPGAVKRARAVRSARRPSRRRGRRFRRRERSAKRRRAPATRRFPIAGRKRAWSSRSRAGPRAPARGGNSSSNGRPTSRRTSRACGAVAGFSPTSQAVAHHRHAVGDARHFLEPMRDVDDADAALAHAGA